MSFTDAEILSQLEKTEDGEYITPQTELWQIDPQSMIEDGNAWRVDNNYSYQRLVDFPVFSSEAAAKRSIRDASQVVADQYEHVRNLACHLAELLAAVTSAGHWSNDGESYTMYGDTYHPSLIESIVEQLQCVDDLLDDEEHVSLAKQVSEPVVRAEPAEADTQRIKDLESHIVGMQVKAESDLKIIKQKTDQIKALQEALHEQRAADKQTYSLACWAAKHEVKLQFYRRYSHIPYDQDTNREMVMELQTPAASSTQLISRGDNVPSMGKLFQDALMTLRDTQESLKG